MHDASQATTRHCWRSAGRCADDLLWDTDLSHEPDSVGDTTLPASSPPPSPIDQVLVMPDAVESDESSAAEATTVHPCGLPHAQNAPPNRRITTSRRIQNIRWEVERLQAALEAAQEQSKNTELTTRLIEGVQTLSSSRAGGMWKPIAARQQQWREQAETENTRLRSLVFAQQRHLQTVHRLLSRRPHRHASFDDDASGLIKMETHPVRVYCTLPS
jgi:hypothetical protein